MSSPALAHQERVIREKRALDENIEKLHAFIVSPISAFSDLSATEQLLMIEQRAAMQRYSLILLRRLAEWGMVLPVDWRYANFEYALLDLDRAYDGQGQAVALHRGPLTARALRETAYAFLKPFDGNAVFLNGLDPTAPQEPAESAAWRNLAKLANAVAAAIDAKV